MVVSPSASSANSTPFKSVFLNASLLKVVITYISAEATGALENVILFKSPDPSLPTVNAFEAPGFCLTLFTNTCKPFSPPAGITASVFLDNNSGSNDVHIVKNATIPAGSSLEVMAGNKLVVQNSGSAGDVIRVSAGTASACDATISVLEDV